MAISLEELAAVALEGTVGPVTLALGAGAVAVALAAGSTRPLRRMAATTVFAANRTRQFSVVGWIDAAKHQWRSLVDEARAEYEAGRQASPVVAAVAEATPPIVVASVNGIVPEAGGVIVIPESADAPEGSAVQEATSTRDGRGRFVRRATNGSRPE